MADLSEKESASTSKIVGASSTGTESNFLQITGNGDAKITNQHTNNYVSVVKSIGATQSLASVGVSNLTNRRELLILNDGNKDIYFGPNGVTGSGATKGIKIGVGAFQSIPVGDTINIYLICPSGTSDVIIQEFA